MFSRCLGQRSLASAMQASTGNSRAYLEGKQRKRTTKKADKQLTSKKAWRIYAEMLNSMNDGEGKLLQPRSKQSRQTAANSLLERQERKIAQDELREDKQETNQNVDERHIKPFFARYDI